MIRYEDLRASGKKPRVHGNGFIQLDLNDDGTKRLHAWDESIPRQVVATPIHDHVFDMRSEVVVGTLIHEELWAREVEDGTHKVYRAQQERGTQNTILVADEGTVGLAVIQRLVLGAGSFYTFPAWHLHESTHDGFTVTLMEKVANHSWNAEKGYGRPRVLVPVGSEPDNDFHRDGFDQEFLWSYIAKACEEIQ